MDSSWGSAAGDKDTPIDAEQGFIGKSDIPEDCPFERSKTLTGIIFTGELRGDSVDQALKLDFSTWEGKSARVKFTRQDADVDAFQLGEK